MGSLEAMAKGSEARYLSDTQNLKIAQVGAGQLMKLECDLLVLGRTRALHSQHSSAQPPMQLWCRGADKYSLQAGKRQC
jgi:hypothetical protein